MPKTREQEILELRQQVEAPSRAQERLREIEAEIAQEKEDEARKVAEKRAVAISRAAGSVASELEDDAQRVLQAAQDYAAAAARFNERFQKYEGLQLENAALMDRFGIKGAKLPNDVLPPERHRVAIDATHVVGNVGFVRESWFIRSAGQEQCEHGIRQRRTYEEVKGTPSFDIITDAGLKPFPELTERQREIIAEREEHARQDQRMLAEYAIEAQRAQLPERTFG